MAKFGQDLPSQRGSSIDRILQLVFRGEIDSYYEQPWPRLDFGQLAVVTSIHPQGVPSQVQPQRTHLSSKDMQLRQKNLFPPST